MKKRLLVFILTFVLLLGLFPTGASAEQSYINSNLGAVEAGSYFSCSLCGNSFPSDVEVNLESGIVPDGCTWYSAGDGESIALYIQGTPRTAGRFEFTLHISGGASGEDTVLKCTIAVNPAVPQVMTGSSVSCKAGESVSISVSATKNDEDAGTLSYQWYSAGSAVNNSGTPISGANSASYYPSTSSTGYYYCIVTNTNGSFSASTVSEPVSVTVSEPDVSSVSVATMPSKTEYKKGEKLDTTGLQLNVLFSDGGRMVIGDGFRAEPSEFKTAGTVTVKVSYKNAECSFTVKVNDDTVQSISIQHLPNKTEYTVGDTLNTAGLVIRVLKGAEIEDVNEGFRCTPTSFVSAGKQTVTVYYKEKTCTFTVDVKEAKEVVQSINIARAPVKSEYRVGEKLDTTGLSLNVVSNKGTKQVTQGFKCSPETFEAVGAHTVTIEYEGVSCTFTVNVKPGPARPEGTEKPDTTEKPKPTASASETVREEEHGGSSRAVLTVIMVVAILGLVAVGAYVVIVNLKLKNKTPSRHSREDKKK